MGQLIASTLASLDGYVADEAGNFDWAAPTDEVHAFVNELSRPVGTYLLGRRMYETLAVWDTFEDEHPAIREFAEIWKGADKVVYSTTLERAWTARTRLERTFDPTSVAAMKASADRDLAIAGPTLAAHAARADLIDEWQVFLVPHLVGGGTRFFAEDVRTVLDLVDERRFADGTVFVRYRTAR